jgi:hypothetical protein
MKSRRMKWEEHVLSTYVIVIIIIMWLCGHCKDLDSLTPDSS